MFQFAGLLVRLSCALAERDCEDDDDNTDTGGGHVRRHCRLTTAQPRHSPGDISVVINEHALYRVISTIGQQHPPFPPDFEKKQQNFCG